MSSNPRSTRAQPDTTAKVTDFVRAPTAAEDVQARVTLGQIDPGVADRLLHKVGFSRSDSSAILSGASWVLETYKGPSDEYVASVDGSEVRRGTTTVGSTGGAPQGAPATATATATATQTVPAGTSTVSTFSTTFTVTRNPKASKLLRCIVNAQGDVNKIVTCQQRFPP